MKSTAYMKPRETYPREILLFRRQFVMGPRFVEQLPSWKRIKIREGQYVTAHPHLQTYQVNLENKGITLLGYILDPNNPCASDAEVIDRLLGELSACDGLDKFLRCTYELGGRWILIVDDGNEISLFTDPMGLRQVMYTNRSFPTELWCASQPGLLAEILNLELDEDAVSEYVNSAVYQEWEEHLWPGDTTQYKEISHLLPNHYLNLKTGACVRYWPNENLDHLTLEEGVEKTSGILTGLIKSAAHRFELALAITAGWDTRLILAASREISHQLYFFTLFTKNRSDATIPSGLLSKLGLSHTVIKYPARMDDEFSDIYNRNVTSAHNSTGNMVQGIYTTNLQGRVCVTGNAAEITRVRFRVPNGRQVTPKTLTRFMSFQYPDDLEKISYVTRAWEKWLSKLGDTHNIHPLDLFYWEHWAGNFAAMGQAGWDISQETFTPYNCRRLLMYMLSVDERYRDHDEPILYKALIQKLWPEVLSEPVNPRLVTIGMALYNSEQHIRGTLDSLRAQDYAYFEVVISDDASTDRTQEICLEYAAKDERIRYYRNERNMGITWNHNRVLELASGQYFKWVGSRDCLVPTCISECKRILDSDSSVVLAYPLACLVDENGASIGELARETLDTRRLPTDARVMTVVAKAGKCSDQLYGLFRTWALRRCRSLSATERDDGVLLMEVSFVGAIAVVPKVLFYRGQPRPLLGEDERRATTILGQSSETRKDEKSRSWWKLWRRYLTSAWRLTSWKQRPYLIPRVAYTLYFR
jgi:hypothetical protein